MNYFPATYHVSGILTGVASHSDIPSKTLGKILANCNKSFIYRTTRDIKNFRNSDYQRDNHHNVETFHTQHYCSSAYSQNVTPSTLSIDNDRGVSRIKPIAQASVHPSLLMTNRSSDTLHTFIDIGQKHLDRNIPAKIHMHTELHL